MCGGAGCDPASVPSSIQLASSIPEYSTIAQPAMSWMDDYYDWVSPKSKCCRLNNSDDKFCPTNGQFFCLENFAFLEFSIWRRKIVVLFSPFKCFFSCYLSLGGVNFSLILKLLRREGHSTLFLLINLYSSSQNLVSMAIVQAEM